MKKGWIIALIAAIILAVIIFIGFRWFSNSNGPNTDSQYQASRTLAENLNTRKSNCKCTTC